ncbi:class II aldolase/adducin family protein [Arthrobacter sp. Cr_A7]|uniref:class II aldolase/adducin family protein n=1 Tax=Arthrobacter sp. Cr_A7 TaxID=3031017 RepID=UPI0023DB505A|nr:class II aldolase/adducin family protein [Arthrobacter sp. Cr_A7]MDF2050479.1 class II aldolase/adducin family protein [Arthrobacter sp. Cr_A7]
MNSPQRLDRKASDDDSLRSMLVVANRILFHNRILDAFGHVSVRSAEDPSSFLLSRNLAPALVREEDIQRFSLDAVTDDPRPSYLERFIHAELFKARPDVQAVVHSHSPSVIPFSVSQRPLRPIMHMAGFLPPNVPVFEIRDAAGDASDLLIRSADLGRALAQTIGSSSVSLMRGHGSVAVGDSLQEVVFRAIYAEVNAQAQAQAEAYGTPTYLLQDEAAAAAASNATQVKRAWDFWAYEVGLAAPR